MLSPWPSSCQDHRWYHTSLLALLKHGCVVLCRTATGTLIGIGGNGMYALEAICPTIKEKVQ
jgi:hypothetical protein